MCERACAHVRATPCEAIPHAGPPVLVRRAGESPLPIKVTGDHPDSRAAVGAAIAPAAPRFRSLSPLADRPRWGHSWADGPATHLPDSPAAPQLRSVNELGGLCLD